MSADLQAKDGNAVALRPHERFVKNLQERAAENNRSMEVTAKQVNKILSAETEADIWDADEGGTVSGQDFTDVEIEIRGYEIAPSDDQYESLFDVYVNIDAVTLQEAKGYGIGEAVIINTGAPLVITKLEMFRARDMFPVQAVIKGTVAKKGTVLKLRPVPKRSTPATTA